MNKTIITERGTSRTLRKGKKKKHNIGTVYDMKHLHAPPDGASMDEALLTHIFVTHFIANQTLTLNRDFVAARKKRTRFCCPDEVVIIHHLFQLTCSPMRSNPTKRNEIPWNRRK